VLGSLLAAGTARSEPAPATPATPGADALTSAPGVSAPQRAGAPRSTLYEAEAARLSGVTRARQRAGYTGRGYADFRRDSGDFVEWKVAAPRAATYVLTWRYGNGGGVDRPLALTINGVTAKRKVSMPPTADGPRGGCQASRPS
jgi:hypothetical protein